MQIGGVLRGRYHLDAPLGRGGMGTVYAATDLASGRPVAIKVVRTNADATLSVRLQREAEAVLRLRSPFVPELYDVDVTENGELFLVMELLRGQSLAQRLRERGGALSWEEVARFGHDVLSGLVDAHEAGVIHRDLKPANIFVVDRGDGTPRAMVLDFGVAKLEGHDGEPITTAGESVGTIAYMAPEQIRGASEVDARADLYSFGIVMFEALTGTLPYDAENQLAVIAQKLERPAPALSDVGHVPIPPGVEALLQRCLRRRPEDRFPSAAALAAEWRALAEGFSSAASAASAAAAQVADVDSEGETQALRVSHPEPVFEERFADPAGEYVSEDMPPSDEPSTHGPVGFRPERHRGSHSLGLLVAGSAVIASIFVLVVSERIRAKPLGGPRPMPSSSVQGTAVESTEVESTAVDSTTVDRSTALGSTALGSTAAPLPSASPKPGGAPSAAAAPATSVSAGREPLERGVAGRRGRP